MIRVEIGPRIVRTARRLGPQVTAEAEKRIAQIAREFGNPRSHSGLGLRKIGRRSYEVRVWLQWRVVLVHHGDRLLAYDILNHNEVVRWLKQRSGD